MSNNGYTAMRTQDQTEDVEDVGSLMFTELSRAETEYTQLSDISESWPFLPQQNVLPLSSPIPCQRIAYAGRTSPREGTMTSEDGEVPWQHDIVQFAAPIFYVAPEEGVLHADIMRIGNMQGRCAVSLHTVSGSAKAGLSFQELSEYVVFEDGEDMRSVEIPILPSSVWTTTFEFKLKLSVPAGCVLGSYLHTARVKIIADTTFPCNRFTDQCQDVTKGVEHIGGWDLFLHTVILIVRSPGLGWRTLAYLVLEQLQNIYLYATLYLLKYLVDVVLKKPQEAEEQLFLQAGPNGGRDYTVLAIAGTFIIPIAFLHVANLMKLNMNLHGRVGGFLREHLFNQYLNYCDESKSALGPSRLQDAITDEVDKIATSYILVLDIATVLGKIIALASFVYFENPHAISASAVMPIVMIAYATCRAGLLRKDNRILNHAQVIVLKVVQETCHKYSLIADYQQRPRIYDIFSDAAQNMEKASTNVGIVTANNAIMGTLLGPLFISLHIVLRTPNVLSGDLTMGSFLAIISVYKEFSAVYSEAYLCYMKISGSLSALKNVTQCFNMPLDLDRRKNLNRMRRQKFKEERHACLLHDLEKPLEERNSIHNFRSDRVDLHISGLSWGYTPGEDVFHNVSLTIPQGSVVGICGVPQSGRSTLMRLLGNVLLPKRGHLFIPSHLRALYVPEALTLLDLSAWANLTFGFPLAHPARVKKILLGLEMQETLEIVREDLAAIGRAQEMDLSLEDGGDNYMPGFVDRVDAIEGSRYTVGSTEQWQVCLTATERLKFSMVRALVLNPEVLIFQRPTSAFEPQEKQKVMDVLLEHVRNRGYQLPEGSRKYRRPRTLFLSYATDEPISQMDYMLELDPKTKGIIHTVCGAAVTHEASWHVPAS